MLRISEAVQPARILLEGRLADEWVDELSRALGSLDDGGCLVLDLTELTFVDQRGVALLRDLASRGASLIGGSTFITTLLRGDDDGASK